MHHGNTDRAEFIPTPEQIAEAMAAIRSRWSDEEHERRARAVPVVVCGGRPGVTAPVPVLRVLPREPYTFPTCTAPVRD